MLEVFVSVINFLLALGKLVRFCGPKRFLAASASQQHSRPRITAGEQRWIRLRESASFTGGEVDRWAQGRGLMGSGMWHVSNTRVDLAANVALGQQRLSKGTTVGDLRFMNQVSRRGRG